MSKIIGHWNVGMIRDLEFRIWSLEVDATRHHPIS